MSTQCFPGDQFHLFDLGINVSELRRLKEKIRMSAKASNTQRAYSSSWKTFTSWCHGAGREALPASADTISLFIAWAAAEGYSALTIRLCVSAINYFHRAEGVPTPFSQEIRDLLSALMRARRGVKGGKLNMTIEQVRSAARLKLGRGAIDARDRSIILLGFAAGWRRCELAALDHDHVTFSRYGVSLFQPFSKNDQEGKGRTVAIPFGRPETCPVRALKSWLKIRGDWAGPIFVRFKAAGRGHKPEITRERLGGEAIASVTKRYLAETGADPSAYGAHSLRSGMITTAHEQGASLRDIMDRSGHRSVDMVMSYIKSSPRAFAADPLRGVL